MLGAAGVSVAVCLGTGRLGHLAKGKKIIMNLNIYSFLLVLGVLTSDTANSTQRENTVFITFFSFHKFIKLLSSMHQTSLFLSFHLPGTLNVLFVGAVLWQPF